MGGEPNGSADRVSGFRSVDEARVLLKAARTLVRSLIDSHYTMLSGAQLLDIGRDMETLSRELRAAQIQLVNELEQQGVAASKSVSSTPKLLREAFRVSAGEASARWAAALATLPQDLPSGGETPPLRPALSAAVHAGALDADHIRTVVSTLRQLPSHLPPTEVDRAEHVLVESALQSDPQQFKLIAGHLTFVIDPDGPEPDPHGPRGKVEFTIGSKSVATGLTPIHGLLDDLGIASLRAVLDPLSAPQAAVQGANDARPAATRRAHALVEVLEFALRHGDDAMPSTGGERPHVTVTLDWDTLNNTAGSAVLDNGYPMTPGDLRRVLCDAKVLPAVLNGKSEVLDVGRAVRLFPTGIRKALNLRDKGCAFPGCDRPPGWCEAHHVRWFTRDLGATSYRNGVLLCGYHHAEIHKGDWQIRMHPDGIPEFIPPTWMDPAQTPLRNAVREFGIFQAREPEGRYPSARAARQARTKEFLRLVRSTEAE